VVKVREGGKSSFTEYRGKIKILKPEIKKEETKEFLAEVPKTPKLENKKLSPKIIALLNSLFSATTILILKLKLKSLQNEKH